MNSSQLKRLVLLLIIFCLQALPALTQSLEVVSTVDPGQAPPAGGNGDSWGPIITPDGRYVLFASTADNLTFLTNNTHIPALIPPHLNVFLRDRAAKATTLVSVNLSGTGGGNADSIPIAVSTNGQYALFESSASDLVAGDTNGAADVFVRDLTRGTTLLVSVNSNGVAGNGTSRSSTITPDGHYVAFVSAASDLVTGHTNGLSDIFVRDLQAGTTVLASVGSVSTNSTLPIGGSEFPQITPDGRFVAFYTTATNLIPGVVPNSSDIYVRDLVQNTTIWASSGARSVFIPQPGIQLHCASHAISSDGHFVAYEVVPTRVGAYYLPASSPVLVRYNLQTGILDVISTNGLAQLPPNENVSTLDMTPDGRFVAFLANSTPTSKEGDSVYVWDAETGVTTLASGDLTGQVPTNSTCAWPSIDPGGRFVVFQSSAANLTTNALVGDYHLYRRDLQTGVTLLVDSDTNGVGSLVNPAMVPSMTPDGRFVTFDCRDGNLVPNDRNHDSDVFVRDLEVGATEMISVHDPALSTLTGNGPSWLGADSVSADGRYVAFTSLADNLTPNDTNLCLDVFVRDRVTEMTVLVSVATNGFSGDFTSAEPAISSDGRYVAFSSSADNLIPSDTNKAQDVFVRDLLAGTTTLVSVFDTNSAVGAKNSSSPVVSSGGRYVLFRNPAGNPYPSVYTGENLFLRDVHRATTYPLTDTGVSAAAMTPNGHYVAYGATGIVSVLYVWDSQAAARIYTNPVPPVFGVAITPDGNRIAVAGSNGLYAVDLAAQTTWLVETNANAYKNLRLSVDGRWLTCTKLPGSLGTTQVYLYDLANLTNVLVSQDSASSGGPNGQSDSPDLSADARFVAYRSSATNIAFGDPNGMPDIFVYDASSGTTTVLSANQQTNLAGNNWSLRPIFSGDGRTLCFTSLASDLIPLDFNHNSDVFAFGFFVAQLSAYATPTQGPGISWPWTTGKSYKVQFKDSLSEETWHDLTGTITNYGNKAYLQDPAPVAAQRFYRVVSF